MSPPDTVASSTAPFLAPGDRQPSHVDVDPRRASWMRGAEGGSSAFEQGAAMRDSANGTPTSEERLEHVLQCARDVGFDNFDDIVSSYYVSKFDDASALFFSQRQSRNRRLPGVLAEMRRSSVTWTQWERQGYCDEVLRTAESILLSEFRSFTRGQTLQDCVNELDQAPIPADPSAEATPQQDEAMEALLSLQRSFYSEIPNLWATLTAMTNDNAALNRQDRAQVVLACSLLLCIAGRIPVSKLNSCISTCLNASREEET